MSLFSSKYQDPEEDKYTVPHKFNVGRRVSVSAECMDDPETTRPASSVPRLDSDEVAEVPDDIVKSLKKIFMFRSVSDDGLAQVSSALRPRIVEKGEVIIKQGEEGDYFYIVDEGSVKFEIDGETVGSAGAGTHFGELALLYNSPRAATVVAAEDGKLWALDRQTFKSIMTRSLTDKREHSRAVLNNISILSSLDSAVQLRLADALQPAKFEKGAVVVRQGDIGDNFYLIDEGTAEVTADGKVLNTLHKGDYFGELALLNQEPRAATVTAVTDLKLEYLDKLGFERLLGKGVVDEMRRRDPRKQH